MKFGVLILRNSANVGDFIQSVAVRNLLPRVDRYIDRDLFLDHALSKEQTAVIVSGWISHRPENWPPAGNIVPLLTSLHISEMSNRIGGSTSKFLLGNDPGYMRQWSPVGARDLRTLELLQAAGIDSYFSGCLTLTLDPAPDGKRGETIICTDVPADILAFIRRKTRRPVLSLTHYEPNLDETAAFARAEELIDQYRRANCVVTTRLHCALPCVAVGTPVLFLDPPEADARLRGLDLLFRHCSSAELMSGRYQFDFDDPPPNDLDYLRYRDQLLAVVRTFVAEVDDAIAAPITDRPFERRFNSLWAVHLETMHDLRGSLEVKDHENTQLRGVLAAGQEEATQLRGLLDTKSTEISQLHATLERADRHAAQLRSMLDAKNEEIAQLHATLASTQGAGAELRSMLQAKTDEIGQLHATLQNTLAEGAQLRGMLAVKDEEIAHLHDALEIQRADGRQLRNVMESKTTEIAELQRALEDRQREGTGGTIAKP